MYKSKLFKYLITINIIFLPIKVKHNLNRRGFKLFQRGLHFPKTNKYIDMSTVTLNCETYFFFFFYVPSCVSLVYMCFFFILKTYFSC